MKNILLVSLPLCFGLVGCTQLQIIAPNPQVESPEVRGDGGMKISANAMGGHAYSSTPDASARPPNTSQPNSFYAEDFNGAVAFSPVEPLELGVEVHPIWRGGGLAGVIKYQFDGEGTRAAAVGDIPVGVYLRVGDNFNEASGDQKELFGPGGYNWKGKMNVAYAHAGFSVGSRLSEHTMIYAGAAVGQYWNSSEINQDANTTSGASSPAGVYKSGDTGFAESVGPGVLFNWKHVQFYVSGTYTHIEYQRLPVQNDFSLSSGISILPY